MEIWKDIKGFEGRYQVSNLGRVKSMPYQYIRKDGRRTVIKGKIKKNTVNGIGYYVTNISGKVYTIHRLISEHFIENQNNYPIINHIDGNKLNNDISNLEWCDYSSNIKHAYDTGLRKFTEKMRKSSRENMKRNSKNQSVMVFNVITGIFYNTIKEASNSIGIDSSCLSRRLSGKVINNTNFVYA